MTQLLIDRATLEQLLVALEEVSDYINRYSIPAHQLELDPIDESIKTLNAALANAELVEPEPKLWLWKNFVDGKQEYWVFDNLYPININDGDPQTLGDPCGYALFKPSRNGRKDTP